MPDRDDSLATSYWEFRERVSVEITELRKDVVHLKEHITEMDLRHAHKQDDLWRAVMDQIGEILRNMDIMQQALLDEQDLRIRKELEWQTLKKYGVVLAIVALLGAGAGMDAATAADLLGKLVNTLP